MKTSGSRQIAERYVRALFDASGKSRAAVEKDLLTLRDALEGSKDLRGLLTNPLLTRGQQAQTMNEVLAALKAHATTKQFIALLAKQKRLAILPQIIAIFMEEAARERGEMSAKLVAASPVTAADAKAISGALSKMSGKKILLETEQNPELLGGLIVKIGSTQLDASLSGKLRRLKNILKAA